MITLQCGCLRVMPSSGCCFDGFLVFQLWRPVISQIPMLDGFAAWSVLASPSKLGQRKHWKMVSDTNLCNFIYWDVGSVLQLDLSDLPDPFLICWDLSYLMEFVKSAFDKVIHCSLAFLSRRFPYTDSYTNWVDWCWLFFAVARLWSFIPKIRPQPRERWVSCLVKLYPNWNAQGEGKCKKKAGICWGKWPFSIKGLFFSIYAMKVSLEAGSCRWKPVKDWKESGAF